MMDFKVGYSPVRQSSEFLRGVDVWLYLGNKSLLRFLLLRNTKVHISTLAHSYSIIYSFNYVIYFCF